MECPRIEGAQALLNWFGYWPTFHDAEVLSIVLKRSGKSQVKVHVFGGTSELDRTGAPAVKHAVATFEFEGFVLDESGLALPG